MSTNSIDNSNGTQLNIKILALEKEYKSVLEQYEEAYQNYINNLNSADQVNTTNYTLIGSATSICTGGDTGLFSDGTPKKTIGYYPKKQCEKICEDDILCSGYDLANKDPNNNYQCNIYAYDDLTSSAGSSNTNGCYKKNNFLAPSTSTIDSYVILGIGEDGMDYVKTDINAPWTKLDNDTSGDLIACAINPINGMYFVVNKSNKACYKNSYTDATFTPLENSCCITDLAISPDGQFVVVIDTNGQLLSGPLSTLMNQDPEADTYELQTVNGNSQTVCSGGGGWNTIPGYPQWYQVTQSDAEIKCSADPQCTAFDMVPNGLNNGTNQCALFANTDITPGIAGGALGCYKKVKNAGIVELASATNPNQSEGSVAVAISPEGSVYTVGGSQLYKKDSYLNLSSELWDGPISNTCCVSSIAFAPDGSMIGTPSTTSDTNLYIKPAGQYTDEWQNIIIPGNMRVVSLATYKTSTTETTYGSKAPSVNTSTFVTIPGKTYWGPSTLNSTNVNSITDCESMCASDLNCTGATFDTSTLLCSTYSGDGNLAVGTDSQTAIIQKIRKDIILLKNLNSKLLNINSNIDNELKQLYPIAKKDIAKKNEKQRELNIYYEKLLKEKLKLENEYNEYKMIEEDYANNSIFVEEESSQFQFWIIFALVLIVITLKILLNIQGYTGLAFVAVGIMVAIYISFTYRSYNSIF